MILIDGYAIDAAISETHKLPSAVTKYAIETGAKIADNVVNDPTEWTVEGIVSDTPIGALVAIRQAEGGVPSVNARVKLETIRANREPVQIVSALRTYDNMLMNDLEFTADADSGDSLHFTCTFEQATIITNNRATVRVASPSGASQSKKKGPSIVVFFAGPVNITGLVSLLPGVWNKAKGRYEYANKGGQPSGRVMPNWDLTAEDPHANDKNPYVNPQTGEWENSDGTPVTQKQLGSADNPQGTKGGNENSTGNDELDAFRDRPWWTHIPGG